MSSVPSVRMARLHFARIRLAQEGVRLPHNVEERANPHTYREHKGSEGEEGAVPLVVILEPLVLGVLPASVLPVSTLLLGVLGLLGLLGAMGTTGVWRELGGVVERARNELAVIEESKEGEEGRVKGSADAGAGASESERRKATGPARRETRGRIGFGEYRACPCVPLRCVW